MIGDEREFIGVQAQIQRVQHAARGRNSEISFHVFGLIPQQRGHAVAALEAEVPSRRSPRRRERQ